MHMHVSVYMLINHTHSLTPTFLFFCPIEVILGQADVEALAYLISVMVMISELLPAWSVQYRVIKVVIWLWCFAHTLVLLSCSHTESTAYLWLCEPVWLCISFKNVLALTDFFFFYNSVLGHWNLKGKLAVMLLFWDKHHFDYINRNMSVSSYLGTCPQPPLQQHLPTTYNFPTLFAIWKTKWAGLASLWLLRFDSMIMTCMFNTQSSHFLGKVILSTVR